MKKIVIHCASGIKNTGDEAILEVLLRSFLPENQVTVISLNAKYSEKMHPHKNVFFVANGDKNAWKSAIEECDLFILGGGGLLQDKSTIYNVARWLTKLKYAQKLGKKTFVYANSLEPVKYGFNKRMIRNALSKVDAATVRDPLSLEVAKELGLDKVTLTADPVFAYPWEESAELTEEDYLVFAIRHWYDSNPLIPVKIANKLGLRSKSDKKKYDRYVRALAKTADLWVSKTGQRIVWLSCCAGRDGKVAEDIIAHMEYPENCRIIDDEDLQPDQMMDIIAGASVIIGMRLHSIIYAFLTGTPMVILSYQQKVRGMAKMAGLEDFCVDVDTFQPKDVAKMAIHLRTIPGLQKDTAAQFLEKMKAAHGKNETIAAELLQ